MCTTQIVDSHKYHLKMSCLKKISYYAINNVLELNRGLKLKEHPTLSIQIKLCKVITHSLQKKTTVNLAPLHPNESIQS